jgi:hypothetical protein
MTGIRLEQQKAHHGPRVTQSEFVGRIFEHAALHAARIEKK